MGGLLTLPLKFSSFITSLSDKGFSYFVSYITTFIYLTVSRCFKKRRFDNYDYNALTDPEKNAFFVPEFEWKVDSPRKDFITPSKKTDAAFCFGVNSKSEALAIHISRQPNGKVYCSLLLQLSDGTVYSLPREHVIQHETNEEHTFGSSRIKLQCILPMRKWRIFFNGLLEESSKENTDGTKIYKHVKMAFICTSSSGIFDFSSDMSKSLLSQNASESVKWNCHPEAFSQWIKHVFDNYEQPGMLLGTVKVEGNSENELYLWGARGRYAGETQDIDDCYLQQIYAYFQNGAVLHMGYLNCDSIRFPYGYLMRSDGFMHPIEIVIEETPNESETQLKYSFFCGNVNYTLSISRSQMENIDFVKEFGGSSTISYCEMALNEHHGNGFIIKGDNKDENKEQAQTYIKSKYSTNASFDIPLCVSFDDLRCQDSSLTGGKGSSLGKLYTISKESNLESKYDVPQGVVVTTNAYKLFIKGKLENDLQILEKEIWAKSDHNFKELCERMTGLVYNTTLPEEIINSAKSHFNNGLLVLNDEKKYAVRSSATGEDTEQMSAAGQMETFLGLRTFDEILDALKKCWASQFTFVAVGYKRRYGQRITTPMAVVIQEMVPCEVAGVAFTCDPMTGHPSYISVTANYGLGESVVSASADPDTIVLKRDIYNNVSLHSQQIGKKQTKVVMTGNSGTEEVALPDNESSHCCLDVNLSVRLAEIAIMIEEKYGSPRDLEWGVVKDNIFLLQARPVTSLDMDSDFETMHFNDVYLRNEKEYLTTGNVGEVLPGAVTMLSMDFFAKIMSLSMIRKLYNKQDILTVPDVPYYNKRIVFSQGHAFFTMVDSLLRFEQEDSDIAKAMMIAILGRINYDENMAKMAKERHDAYGKTHKTNPVLMNFFLGVIFLSVAIQKLFPTKHKKVFFSVSENLSALEMLRDIGTKLHITSKSMKEHVSCTISSSVYNMFLLATLSKAEGEWNNNVFSDFAYLLSTCTGVESADVPQKMQKLAFAIGKSIDSQEFVKMDGEAALKWLENSDSEAGIKYRDFLDKHGHRCLKEFDLHSETWGTNPSALLKILQDLVGANVKDAFDKKIPSFDHLMAKMNIRLSFYARLKMHLFLPNCWRGVRDREASKSVYIGILNQLRQVVWKMGDKMKLEGFIPDGKLIHFLCVEEIVQLLKTRSPRIVARAIRRQKFHNQMDKLLFPEMTSGPPKPINASENIDSTAKGFSMTGVPVSQGVVKSIARVVTNLEDAVAIQPGDILIAYSTDIGWSPYFPLLSGVVTELGGLISHGAVVAREYGLPCVVGLHGATRAFNSGDMVILDGNKGTLTRVDSD